MSRIHLVPVGPFPASVLEELRRGLAAYTGARCTLDPGQMDSRFAFHPERRQHHATEILARLSAGDYGDAWRVLGITSADLYIPILTFVFGEAQNPGRCAVVSSHRLRQEYYGLPGDAPLLARRLLTEAVHELGHTMGLVHCPVRTCAMAGAHEVEILDLKEPALCPVCRESAGALAAKAPVIRT